MDWNCTITEERLSEYLEGQLSAGDAAALDAHTRSCAQCSELVARMGSLLGRMHSMEMVEEPEALQRKILDATLGPRPKKQGWRRWFAWTPAIWQPRFAIGMATVAACAVIVVQAGGVLPTKFHKANLAPGAVLRNVKRQAHLTYAQGVKFVSGLRVVYEIESRLQPQNPPQENPSQPERNELQPNQKNPQEKSDQRPGRSQARSDILYAEVAPSETVTPAREDRPLADTAFEPVANHTRLTSVTHADRAAARGRSSHDLLAARGPNLDQGSAESAATSLATVGPAKPEWSAP
jgi:Putative zinc-finger